MTRAKQKVSKWRMARSDLAFLLNYSSKTRQGTSLKGGFGTKSFGADKGWRLHGFGARYFTLVFKNSCTHNSVVES
ncbi:hypothetical protein CDAR_582181 [Caerostris darwini]|uniref:Uncharacterized protein n=1 Tax=Caerostris darwini TaxID=1538125 RepID=A0AAV4MFB7_9ARAC|nr:hypothetical protein CDAR_582181 [Caerostris darwini]